MTSLLPDAVLVSISRIMAVVSGRVFVRPPAIRCCTRALRFNPGHQVAHRRPENTEKSFTSVLATATGVHLWSFCTWMQRCCRMPVPNLAWRNSHLVVFSNFISTSRRRCNPIFIYSEFPWMTHMVAPYHVRYITQLHFTIQIKFI